MITFDSLCWPSNDVTGAGFGDVDFFFSFRRWAVQWDFLQILRNREKIFVVELTSQHAVVVIVVGDSWNLFFLYPIAVILSSLLIFFVIL
jgi:hypothetical protein